MGSVEVVFRFWNSQKVKTHAQITDAIRQRIEIALRRFGIVRVLEGIAVYGWAVNDPNSWRGRFPRWSLYDFLRSGKPEAFLNTPRRELMKDNLDEKAPLDSIRKLELYSIENFEDWIRKFFPEAVPLIPKAAEPGATS